MNIEQNPYENFGQAQNTLATVDSRNERATSTLPNTQTDSLVGVGLTTRQVQIVSSTKAMAAKIIPLSARKRKEELFQRRSNSVMPVEAHESLNYSTLTSKFPNQNLLDVNIQS